MGTLQHPWLLIFVALGVMQGLLLGLAMLQSKKGHVLANRLLAVLIFLLTIELLYGLLFLSGGILRLPHLFRLNTPFTFLLGPVLYLYCKTIANRQFRFKKNRLWHALPWLMCLLYLLPLYVESSAWKLDQLRSMALTLPTSSLILGGARRLHIGIYLTACIWFLIRARSHQHGEAGQKNNLTWFLWFLMVLAVLNWGLDLYDFIFAFNLYTWTNVLQIAINTALILVGNYLCLARPEWHFEHSANGRPIPQGEKPDPEMGLILAQTREWLEQQRVFLNPNLTLPQLARDLGTNPHKLSRAINSLTGQNFAAFINGFRIDHARSALVKEENQHLKIAEIAFQSGFNSTSAFNQAFKKNTGTTPTQFMKEQKNAAMSQS